MSSELEASFICFIVKVPARMIKEIKSSLVDVAGAIQYNEQGYFYHSKNEKISKWNGDFVGDIANTEINTEHLGTAMKKSVMLSAYHDINIRKMFFIVTKSVNPEEYREIQNVLSYELRNDYNSSFFLISLEEQKKTFSHPRLEQVCLTIPEIYNYIMEKYGEYVIG